MKKISMILALFALSLYATGGGGGGGEPPIKYTNQEYYCFDNIGKQTSYVELPGTNDYCAPVQQGACSWDWKLDYSDDTPSKINCNAGFACNPSLPGMQIKKPVDVYQFCVKSNTWHNVAQCVDKKQGKQANNSQCGKGDANYYWKPKCDPKKSKNDCMWSLEGQQWYSCFNDTTSQGAQSKDGHIVIKEWLGGGYSSNIKLPCTPLAKFNNGGGWTPPEAKVGKLIIRDYDNKDTSKSFIWTKMSGKSARFKIHAEVTTGNVTGTSGIKSLTCSIDGKNASNAKEEGSGIFGLNKFFVYATDDFQFTGTHNITCNGVATDGTTLVGSVDFYSAPAKYEYSNVSAKFGNNFVENLISTAKAVEAGRTETFNHDNKLWTKKPVIPANSNFSIAAEGVRVLNDKNEVDTGVDSAIEVKVENKSKQVTSSDVPPKTSDTTACQTAQIPSATLAVNQGIAAAADLITLAYPSPILGLMTLTLEDTTIKAKIEEEKTQGKCGSGSAPTCPYPGIAKIAFEYQIIPSMFQVELLNDNGTVIKVLYFGQGHTPSIESPNKIRVTALAGNATATTFTKGCGAQDVVVNLNADSAVGYYVELVDKDGNSVGTKVPYSEFKNGVAEASAYIKVKKSKDMDFTPNMKSEPVVLQGGLKAQVEFNGLTPDTPSYYPRYDQIPTGGDMVILRGRINAIDTDNGGAKLGGLTPDNTKVYYEFQCEYCNLDAVGKITGVNNYERSKTQQGWWIDKTFSSYNATQITKDKLEIENLGNAQIKAVSGVTNGFQDIAYSLLGNGTYKLNIRHGVIKDNAGKTIDAMPNFLLYNAYWNSSVKWNTSAFIYIKGKADDEQRNYGVDTGGAKNTRSGGRIGRY